MNDTDTVTFTVGDLRRAAEKCPNVKRVLEAMKPEVFEKEFDPKQGDYLIGKGSGDPYLCIGDDQIIDIISGNNQRNAQPYVEWFRYMRSGIILINIKDGRVVKAQVRED